MVSFVQSVPWIFCYLTPSINHLNSIQPFSHCGHSLELSMSSTPSMTYRVLLVVPTYLPNWLLVLPPKNGFNTCSESILVFWSISIDLIWSSRFKIMVNSNLNLHQRLFMIPVAVHTWYQLRLTLDTSCGSHLIPAAIHTWYQLRFTPDTSCGSHLVWLWSKPSNSFTALLTGKWWIFRKFTQSYFVQLPTIFCFSELPPLDFSNGLWTYWSLTIWTPWLDYKSWSVLLLCLSNGFSKKSAMYPHNCGYPVWILRLCNWLGCSIPLLDVFIYPKVLKVD
jgi:hypothetical protein